MVLLFLSLDSAQRTALHHLRLFCRRGLAAHFRWKGVNALLEERVMEAGRRIYAGEFGKRGFV